MDGSFPRAYAAKRHRRKAHDEMTRFTIGIQEYRVWGVLNSSLDEVSEIGKISVRGT